MAKPTTLRELRASGYVSRSVKEEMRDNLIARLRTGEPLFPGIVGYDETVVPQVENAILSGQDIIFLGERGQAKTRIARTLVEPARRVDAGHRRLRDQRRPARADLLGRAARWSPSRATTRAIDWLAARPPLRREARHAGHHHRRPDRRGRPDQGGRGPLPLRRADDPLRPAAAHEPRHLRHQRAARPGRAHPGRPAQHHGGARRPDPRLQGAPAARPVRGRVAPTRRTTPTAAASSRRSRTASARRSARTTRGPVEHEIDDHGAGARASSTTTAYDTHGARRT